MKKTVTMRQALSDPALLADALPGDSWSAWRTILIACMGEELLPDEREMFAKLTGGREREPGEPVEMLLVVAGRRSGKSRALSVLATYLACLCDWSEHLFIGEIGTALYQAPTQRQAASALKYATDLIDSRRAVVEDCREPDGGLPDIAPLHRADGCGGELAL